MDYDSNITDEAEITTNYGTKTASGNPRIYNCKQCNRAFTREEHLTRHTLSTHNKLKPFTCGICQRPFSRRDLLLRHAKNLHQGSELAVSRIRKSYKRSELASSTPVSLTNSTSQEYENSPTSLASSSPTDSSPPATRRSIDNSDLLSKIDVSLHQNQNQHQHRPQVQHQLLPIHHQKHQQLPLQHSLQHQHQLQHQLQNLHTSQQVPPPLLTSPGLLNTEASAQASTFSPAISPDGYETPEKKRLKMSVNMLVS